MANKEISELSEITNTASGDFFIVVDSQDDNKIKKIAVNDAIKVTKNNVFERYVFGRDSNSTFLSGDFNVTKNTTRTPNANVVLNLNGFDAFHIPIHVVDEIRVDCFDVGILGLQNHEFISFSGIGNVSTSGSGGTIDFRFKEVVNSGTLVDVLLNNAENQATPDKSATGTLTGIRVTQLTELRESGNSYFNLVNTLNIDVPVGPFTFTAFIDNVQS